MIVVPSFDLLVIFQRNPIHGKIPVESALYQHRPRFVQLVTAVYLFFFLTQTSPWHVRFPAIRSYYLQSAKPKMHAKIHLQAKFGETRMPGKVNCYVGRKRRCCRPTTCFLSWCVCCHGEIPSELWWPGSYFYFLPYMWERLTHGKMQVRRPSNIRIVVLAVVQQLLLRLCESYFGHFDKERRRNTLELLLRSFDISCTCIERCPFWANTMWTLRWETQREMKDDEALFSRSIDSWSISVPNPSSSRDGYHSFGSKHPWIESFRNSKVRKNQMRISEIIPSTLPQWNSAILNTERWNRALESNQEFMSEINRDILPLVSPARRVILLEFVRS